MRLVISLLLAVILPALATCSLAADVSPESALQVTSTDLQVVSTPARRAEAYVVVTNVSSRRIVVFSYSATARYADGSEQTTRHRVDLLTTLMMERLRPLGVDQKTPSERLGPGDSRKITALFPLSGDGLAPVSVTTRISMVVFDDSTALGELAEIRQLQSQQMEFAEMLAAEVADLRTVKDSASPKDTLDKLIMSLEGKASTGNSGRLSSLRLLAKALDRPGALDQVLAAYEAQLAFVKQYSNLGVPPLPAPATRAASQPATAPVVESIKVSTLPEPLQSTVREKMSPFQGRQVSRESTREMVNAVRQVDSRLRLLGVGALGEFEVILDKSPSPTATSSWQANFPLTPGVQRINVNGNVQQSKVISRPNFVYPPQARDARISGTVRFDVMIGTDGRVKGVQLVSGPPLLVPAAQEVVAQSVYQPTSVNGEPVEVQTQVVMNFTLQ